MNVFCQRQMPLMCGIALLAALLCAHEAGAEESVRYGLFVGQNDGGASIHSLLYAESDAQRMQELFGRIGAIEARNSRLLTSVNPAQVVRAVRDVGRAVESARRTGLRQVVVFYYSGHADARGLRLGERVLEIDRLKSELQQTRADLRLVILDACQSGQATRTKGGRVAPAFLIEVDQDGALEGEVVITSSAANEASQESDRVGGGYFTHHLAVGLLGAADTSRDGQVTLEEAYAYTYHRTLFETAGSAGGLQHPSFSSDLQGHGMLVLTRPDRAQTMMVFPPGLEGTFLVFDRDRKLFVADVQLSGAEERRLSLPAGRYLVQKRTPDHLLTAELYLTRGGVQSVEEARMQRTGFEEDFSRGVEEANFRRATRAQLVVSALAGIQRFTFQPVEPVLFLDMPLVGLELEWRGLIGPNWSLFLDVAMGGVVGELEFDAYGIPAVYRELAIGAGIKYGRSMGPLRLAVGPHLGGLYVARSFPGTDQAYQDFSMLTPGLVGDISISPTSRMSVGVQGRGHLLYYYVEGEDQGLGYGEALLKLSWTF